jgi:hypothetical protein
MRQRGGRRSPGAVLAQDLLDTSELAGVGSLERLLEGRCGFGLALFEPV